MQSSTWRVKGAAREPLPTAPAEWVDVMQTKATNGLLIAPADVVDAVFEILIGRLRQPLAEWTLNGYAWDGRNDLATLVLHDILLLSPREQRSLFVWMNDEGRNCRIVSFACLPVFPLVKEGRFLPSLYYRLNVVYGEQQA